MVVSDASIHNIMGGMESTGGVRLHNHRRKLKQRFDIIKKLGQGTYGKVQLGINKETGQEVAIKTIKKAKIETEADLVRIRREIQIMSSVQHPNIIHIYEVFENREKMVLVMEYAAGGELYDYLSERKVLSEDEARRIFRQISTAVYYCHKHKICHRDLKLENILLDEHGSAKIADFGLSNVFDEQRLLNTFCGSPLYASPEIVKGTPYHGPEVDCWSLGVLLYTLVYGAMPFDGSNFKRLVRQISQGDYFEPKKPSPASPLIREMLTVTPGRRADIEKICSHWWVNEGYGESCLEIAEELANQTPVRLDLLLSLAPPAPNVGSDKLLVGAEQDGGATGMGNDVLTSVPARCHSVGSLMELDHRPSDVILEDVAGKDTAKRKLEGGISTEEANRGASKRKERSRRSTRERSSERHRGRSSSRSKQKSDSVSTEEPMEVDSGVVDVDRSLQGSVETIVGSVKTATSSVDTIAGSSVQMDEGLETMASSTPKNRTATDLVKELEESEPLSPENECSAKPQDNVQMPDDEGESAKIKVKRKKKVVSESKGVAEDSGPQVMDQVNLESVSVLDNTKVPTICDNVKNDSSVTLEAALQNSLIGDHINAEVSETASSVGELDVNGVSINGTSAAVSPPVDIPKKIGTKTRRSKGELSLGKLGSGSEKSSGANTPEDTASPPSKPMERRRSKIFETAEKFNMLAGAEPKSPTPEKAKKVFIPGVKVSDAKRAFEKKSSSAVSVPSLAKSSSSKKTEDSKTEISDIENYESTVEENNAFLNNKDALPITKAMNGEEEIVAVQNETNAVINETSKKLSDLELNDQPVPCVNESPAVLQKEDSLKFIPPLKTSEKPNKQEEARIKKLKDAVEIISNAITEGHRKEAGADNTKKGTATKPPVPVPQELKTKTKTINITTPLSPKSPPLSPVDLQTEVPERRTDKEPDSNDYASGMNTDAANRKKSSKVEITLKSATLPRRKTSKAEIRLNSPSIAPAGFHTEVSHMIEPAELTSQRSEAAFPVSVAAPKQPPRSVSLEPEGRISKPREHIIPIHVEEGNAVRPPVPPTQQRVYTSQRSGSLSRQSTQDSDTDSTVSVGPEPIRKSPREYIIPIAVEGGGYVTPRAGSLEPSISDENNTKPRQRKTSRFGRHRRMSGLLSDASEDEGFNSPFATLQRHSSLSRDKEPETPEEEKGAFHMHRLRSSRPNRSTLERNDSLSSAEDDDDDDGFEILTAESLFSTLLSRVRSLTQRLNVEDGARPGFPTSTLMSQLKNVGRTPPSRFWNSMGEPLSSYRLVYEEKKISKLERLSETSHFSRPFSRDQDIPWRRSASRDVSDSGSVYSDNSGTVPRASVRVTVHVPAGRVRAGLSTTATH
ncbi:serine/threonine-protein kinase par-1-like isoform X1 [Schistocerca nitens]|uniref:serine/threonine-protein kinase par-1-like isoform X1 n=1 Tax=Schistocerca nitens TaxID=7011 RepID=UPI0021190526|nr:serine/threonine-protein kinase par-1-like isoform X1 [Schistocerca nitens]